jgi:hypothetical protein
MRWLTVARGDLRVWPKVMRRSKMELGVLLVTNAGMRLRKFSSFHYSCRTILLRSGWEGFSHAARTES